MICRLDLVGFIVHFIFISGASFHDLCDTDPYLQLNYLSMLTSNILVYCTLLGLANSYQRFKMFSLIIHFVSDVT